MPTIVEIAIYTGVPGVALWVCFRAFKHLIKETLKKKTKLHPDQVYKLMNRSLLIIVFVAALVLTFNFILEYSNQTSTIADKEPFIHQSPRDTTEETPPLSPPTPKGKILYEVTLQYPDDAKNPDITLDDSIQVTGGLISCKVLVPEGTHEISLKDDSNSWTTLFDAKERLVIKERFKLASK